MLKKTINYPDLDGNMIAEDFYFNLSKAEIAEMELSHKGGFSGYLNKIIEEEDGAEIIKAFKEIILSSIGRRSEDNKRFIKNQDIKDEFEQSEAYSTLFMELVTDGAKAASFVEAVVPQDMKEALSSGKPMTDIPLPEGDKTPAYILEDREPTMKELQEMSPEDLKEAFRRKSTDNQ